MAYVLIESHDPLDQPVHVYGPVETREEAFDLKVRLAHTTRKFLKIVDLGTMDELDPFNYEENRRIDDA